MKIKHFIITRYFTVDDVYGEEMYTYDFLYSWFDLFKNNLISSLNNINNRNFELIIMIHNKVNKKNVSFFNKLKVDYKITILHFNEIQKYLDSFYNKYDYIIESRMDFDDFVFNDVITDIQSKVNENITIKLYGYCSGYTYYKLNEKYYDFFHTVKNIGHWGICSSIIYNTKFVKNTKHFNIYSFNHGRSKINLQTWCKDNNIQWNDNMFEQNKDIKAFIYYRPLNSYSELLNKRNNIEYKLPRYTNKEIKKPNNLKEIFGFNY